jgi:hypothetical protein
MSAYIVDNAHINGIVSWAGKHGVLVQHSNPLKSWSVAGNEQQTAEMLLQENTASVNCRYGN